MSGSKWIQELRRAYPTMSALTFIGIFEKYKDSDDLLDHLGPAEENAVKEKAEEDRRFRELRHQLSMSEQHTRLDIVVHADVDLLHAQAILVYGFLMPGQGKVFVATNKQASRHVRSNVERKLLGRFSADKYENAMHYLKNHGVLLSSGSRSHMTLSVCFEDGGKDVTAHGGQIIRAVKKFLHYK